ncbi:hypothetical protein [Amorphus orientalis]|uniref:Tox-PAAR-like domain-containing protein n=1 Tax=Amorphus orientalis TaxID=649198 RepID=A0AAE4ARV6_9HYPH|nr:hypothetical protein [Amorphus orientalis]MDQ0314280.1 hypothetical protein [Amorphus orientalis]
MIFNDCTSPTGTNTNLSVDLVPSVPPIPTPTCNTGFKATVVPSQVTNFSCCMPAKRVLDTTTTSVGDIAPSVTGGQIAMMNRDATCKIGYFVVFMPSTAMLNVSLPDGIPPSGIGAQLSPCQIKQLLLMPA